MIPDRDSPPHEAFSHGRTASLSPERTQTAAYMITTLLSFQGHSFLRRIFPPDRSRNRYGACRDDTPRKNPDKAAHASPALSRTAVPQLPRSPPENRRTRKRHRLGVVPVPSAENRARSSVRQPTAFFLPVETIRYRAAGSERPQEAAVPIAGRTPPGKTNAAAFRPAGNLPHRNGSDEMPLRPPRNGDRRFEIRVSRKQTERKRPHSAECGRFSLRRSVRIGRSSRSDQSNAAIFSSSTLSGHTPT